MRGICARAMRRVAAGERAHSVAAVLKGSVSSIITWAPRQRRTGSVAGKMGGHRSLRVSGEHRTWLLARLRGIPRSPCAVWQGSLANGGSRFVTGRSGASRTARARASKKTVLPAEQLRLKLARHRARWKAHQGKGDQSRRVFLDETWIKTHRAPLRGWGPRRKRLVAHVPHGHWKTMTWPRCAVTGATHHGCSLGQATARPSRLMSETNFAKPGNRETSSCGIILAAPRERQCVT
jgi:hypothetical protein